MATQGLVTVMHDGKVIYKIVAGCNGYNASKLAQSIRESWPLLLPEIFNMASRLGFGSSRCRVVISRDAVKYIGTEPLGVLYRATFDLPEFNPRWEHGTVDHYELVEV